MMGRSKAKEMSSGSEVMGEFSECIFTRRWLYSNIQCFRILSTYAC